MVKAIPLERIFERVEFIGDSIGILSATIYESQLFLNMGLVSVPFHLPADAEEFEQPVESPRLRAKSRSVYFADAMSLLIFELTGWLALL